jgi:hypothetical protein
MNSLLGNIDCERLPLVDAELLFWPQADLDQDYAQLLATLIGDSSWRQ